MFGKSGLKTLSTINLNLLNSINHHSQKFQIDNFLSSIYYKYEQVPVQVLHVYCTLYSYRIRHLNSHSWKFPCGLPQLPFKGEPGKGLNSTFLEEFKHQTVRMDLPSATHHHHRHVDASAPHSHCIHLGVVASRHSGPCRMCLEAG